MAVMMNDKLNNWASFASKISRKYVESEMESNRLIGVPARNPYSYVVCAWGFVEFFNDTVRGAKGFEKPQIFLDTHLELASFHGHVKLVRRLIEAGPGKEIQQVSTAALLDACKEGHYRIAELLLGAGADPSPALTSNFTGDFDHIVRLLIDLGAVINPQEPSLIIGTPLQLASMNGHLKTAQVLVNSGAEINIPGRLYGNALQRASQNGHEDVVRLLLDHDADVNFGNGILVSPLLAAAHGGRHEIIRLLLERGTDPNHFSGLLGSPLEWVSSSNLELVELLIKHGANANGPRPQYGTPLENAAANGQLEIVRVLLDSGAVINSQDGKKDTALVSAARKGYYDVVQLLLERGVDVEKQGPRACWKASKHSHTGIVELLMGHGAQMPDNQDGFSSNSEQSDEDNEEDEYDDDDGDEDEDEE
ncbi:ankyrin repeat-containing domain protein [Talaromyces proteolyticus]|uniref:Ankyrin repeat-containing domain protein n=1 Tax=Talaromyces proteolyticus TaxID=1131652 RepID=A0AAD4PVR6_9EURO|nr:ankyrin repeat-containing domain protein [Talaromyces proteolyticus]KAH8697050.1 ankyrin repeat-containing domain protein [Talaromyces proteolyticus]